MTTATTHHSAPYTITDLQRGESHGGRVFLDFRSDRLRFDSTVIVDPDTLDVRFIGGTVDETFTLADDAVHGCVDTDDLATFAALDAVERFAGQPAY